MSRLRGLYVITDARLIPDARLTAAVEQAIAGGARMVQYRDKGADATRLHGHAEALAKLCRARGAMFIINDDPALAAAVRADGVHLGRDDGDIAAARTLLGPDAVIGVSCYNQLERAKAAVAAGADYVAFGSFFPSSVKPDAVRAAPALLREAKACLRVPLVAIGGITSANGAALVTAGADMLAVISDVFGHDDIRAAARRIAQLFP
ncbi:MAG: thiamine phosphate synthase [Gammaproteobacteria bacterium]|nr:thiamine phosphate synthase [Gammaproteobacteria bacterium]